jgi:cold shock protein
MKQGEVKFYNQTKEFGFLKDTDEGTEYFFHKTAVEGPLPRDGDKVEFEGETGERGPRATKVKKAA